MSFLPINEQNKEAPTGQTTNVPGTQAPPQTSGSAGTAGTAPKSASTGTPTQFGSSASKLGDYLSANAPQITDQANTIAGGLNQQYGNVSQGITNAANQFGQQVQGGYAAANPDLISQAMQNPSDFASKPENVQGFQGQYNDVYTGPQTFEGTSPYSDIQNQVSQAVQQGNLLSTPAGLQSYLQSQGNNPSRASSTLDALLLQGNPEAQAKIQTAGQQLGTLGGQLQMATTGADQSVLAAQKAAQDAAAYAQGQFNPYVQQFGNQLTNQQAQAQKDYTNYNQGVQGYQSNIGNVTQLLNQFPELLQQYGTSFSGGFKSPYPTNPDFGPMPSLISTVPSLSNVATPEQYAQAAALQQLVGSNNLNIPLDQANAGQAGTFKVSGAVPNNQAFIDALTNAQNWAANPMVNQKLVVPGGYGNLQNFLDQANSLYGNIGNEISQLGGTASTVKNPFHVGA